MDFIDLCVKAFKFFGCVILLVFAFAIVPYLLLLALSVALFMAIIGGVVVLLGTVLSCFTGKDYNFDGVVKSLKGYVTKAWNAVASFFRRILKK